MGFSRVSAVTLLLALAAGLVAYQMAHGLALTLAGFTLLVTLIGYDERGVRSALQSFAFGGTAGVAFLCTVFYPYTLLVGEPGTTSLAKETPGFIWLLGMLIFFAVDVARMSGRQSLSLQSARQAPVSFAPANYAPAPPPASVFSFAAAPITVSRPEPPAAPAAFSPAYVEETQPIAVPSPTAAVPEPPAAVAPAAAPVTPMPSGKPATIYLNMLGEGMNVLRAVAAEHLGRDFYIIMEPTPADERWEFQQGQVVRCKKKTLSNGKGLVAFEEAPRAQ